MDLWLDHVTVAGDQLEELERSFAEAGLHPDYGGVHSNDITHMSQIGFDDGSYVELISTLEYGVRAPWWDEHIRRNAGPCAWALGIDDIRAAATDLAERGVPVIGPESYSREREDGTVVEFELAFLGGGEPGTELPFLITDRTPRRRRITASDSVASGPLTGVEEVILGVPDVDSTIDRFRHAFDVRQPEQESHPEFGAVITDVSELPVSLAMPVGETWLADRVHRLDVCPCAYLLGTDDLDAAVDEYDLSREEPWFGRRTAWFDDNHAILPDGQLGVIEIDG